MSRSSEGRGIVCMNMNKHSIDIGDFLYFLFKKITFLFIRLMWNICEVCGLFLRLLSSDVMAKLSLCGWSSVLWPANWSWFSVTHLELGYVALEIGIEHRLPWRLVDFGLVIIFWLHFKIRTRTVWPTQYTFVYGKRFGTLHFTTFFLIWRTVYDTTCLV